MARTLFIILCFCIQAMALPPGFDGGSLKKVVDGEILRKVVTDTAKEYHQINKAFMRRQGDVLSVEDYLKTVTDHPLYGDIFDEIEEGRTIGGDGVKLFKYLMTLLVDLGFTSVDIDAKGQQELKLSKDTSKRSILRNYLTSHKDKVEKAEAVTYMMGYIDGVLVVDSIHLITKGTSLHDKVIKHQLKKFFGKYTRTFRDHLLEE